MIFTDVAGTQAALQMAEGLAQQLGAHIRLLMPYEVPYALPLAKPAVPVEFLEGQIRNLARETGPGSRGADLFVPRQGSALGTPAQAAFADCCGGKKRWWPTAAQKLAQALQKDGHHVIFAELR